MTSLDSKCHFVSRPFLRLRLALLFASLASCAREVRVADGVGGASAQPAATSPAATSSSTSTDYAATSSGPGTTGAGGAGGTVASVGTGPFALTGDVLDPNEVYIGGSILPALVDNEGIAHWSAPNSVVAGFDSLASPQLGQVRSDGRLIYGMAEVQPHLHEFRCDACPYQGTYPSAPTANDPAIPALQCEAVVSGSVGFLLSPDGAMLHTCYDPSHVWYDANGTAAYTDPTYDLNHLTYGNLALTYGDQLVDLTTSTRVALTGFPAKPYFVGRALPPPDAFLMLFQQTDGMGLDGSQEVWKMDRNGMGSFVGALPPLPPGTVLDPQYLIAIDGHGAVFQRAQKGDNGPYVLVRRTTTGDSAIVLDSTDQLTLYFGGLFGLVTGP